VAEASSKQVSNGSDPNNDWNQGYGYQFWRCRHNIFRGDGAFGQYCIVMPDQDAVLAITSGVDDMQAVLNLVWEKLLPAFEPKALPEDLAANKALAKKLAGLQLAAPQGVSMPADVKKGAQRRFAFVTNPLKLKEIAFDFSSNGCLLSLLHGSKEVQIDCGWGEWKKSVSKIFSDRRDKQAGSCRWISEKVLEITLRRYETPFYTTLKCEFDGEQVKVFGAVNVGFGPTEFPPLVGKAV
jgi:hypothetical protein